MKVSCISKLITYNLSLKLIENRSPLNIVKTDCLKSDFGFDIKFILVAINIRFIGGNGIVNIKKVIIGYKE